MSVFERETVREGVLEREREDLRETWGGRESERKGERVFGGGERICEGERQREYIRGRGFESAGKIERKGESVRQNWRETACLGRGVREGGMCVTGSC